jgi:hypothetical protein
MFLVHHAGLLNVLRGALHKIIRERNSIPIKHIEFDVTNPDTKFKNLTTEQQRELETFWYESFEPQIKNPSSSKSIFERYQNGELTEREQYELDINIQGSDKDDLPDHNSLQCHSDFPSGMSRSGSLTP